MSKYIYPETKFATENAPEKQDEHILSEIIEWTEAITQEEKIMELIDLQHTIETRLRMYKKSGIDVGDFQRRIVEKNRKRKYYPACERCAAPRCANTECIVCREYLCRADLLHWCNENCFGFIRKEVTDV